MPNSPVEEVSREWNFFFFKRTRSSFQWILSSTFLFSLFFNQHLKVTKTRPWALPFWVCRYESVTSWARWACVAEVYITSWANLFCSSSVKIERTWLRHDEYLHIFWVVWPELASQLGSPVITRHWTNSVHRTADTACVIIISNQIGLYCLYICMCVSFFLFIWVGRIQVRSYRQSGSILICCHKSTKPYFSCCFCCLSFFFFFLFFFFFFWGMGWCWVAVVALFVYCVFVCLFFVQC